MLSDATCEKIPEIRHVSIIALNSSEGVNYVYIYNTKVYMREYNIIVSLKNDKKKNKILWKEKTKRKLYSGLKSVPIHDKHILF